MAHYFSFIDNKTLKIICQRDTDLTFRRALNERLAVTIFLVKQYATISKDEVENVLNETSKSKTLVSKGCSHLGSFVSRLHISNALRWDDLFGRCALDENKKLSHRSISIYQIQIEG